MRKFAIVDASTPNRFLDPSDPNRPYLHGFEAGWLRTVAQVIEAQLNREVAQHWGGLSQVRFALPERRSLRLPDGPDNRTLVLENDETVVAIVDSLLENCLVFGSSSGKKLTVIHVPLSVCYTLDDVSVLLSHEIISARVDRGKDLWSDGAFGKQHAIEICHPVESSSYRIGSVSVAAFVTAEYFSSDSEGPHAFLGTTPELERGEAPRSPMSPAPGGYQIVRDGEKVTVIGEIPLHKREKKAHWSSRTFSRGAGDLASAAAPAPAMPAAPQAPQLPAAVAEAITVVPPEVIVPDEAKPPVLEATIEEHALPEIVVIPRGPRRSFRTLGAPRERRSVWGYLQLAWWGLLAVFLNLPKTVRP